MAGSSFGTLFKITTWGESHGAAIGVVVDGCPAGLPLSEQDIQQFLDRRKPGQSRYSTSRKETDRAEILSGIFEGRTTGTPISILVANHDQRSHDYGKIKDCYRPGHADYTFDAKYGFRDYRGGGRSSGRETIGRVAAGAVAASFLSALGIQFTTFTRSIGAISVPQSETDYSCINDNPLFMPGAAYAEQAADYLEQCMRTHDSAGGIVECIVHGLPSGLGQPVFDKLDALLAQAVMSIGAVKGVEIGDGFFAASSVGSQNNDAFCFRDGKIQKDTNHAGGVLGGISDGSPLILRAAIKPTPSIAQTQHTVSRDMQNTELVITGRHDPVIVPRAVVVVESMAALTIADLLLIHMSSRLDSVIDFYKRR